MLAQFLRRGAPAIGLLLCGVLLANILKSPEAPARADGPEKSDAAVANPPAAPEAIPIWPADAPGEKGDVGAETTDVNHDTYRGDMTFIRKVTKPTIAVYRPAADKANGAAVIVCPGGGYGGLAYDFEGSEVCQWLNSIGVTGVLLKYRVPGRGDGPFSYRSSDGTHGNFTAPLQDAQRALSLVRSRAKDWQIDPKRLGIMGFSAGGHLSAATSTNYDTRAYTAIDAADQESCRPDFTMLVYPAYMLANDPPPLKLSPEIKVTANTPPAFLVMAANDPLHVANVYAYALALHKNKVGAEAHVFHTGGHGFGVRAKLHPNPDWTHLAAEWLRTEGWLETKK